MSSIVSNMMDFTNQFQQCFSLPNSLIYTIFESSKLCSSQKLMKSCKTFKLLHLKFGKSDIKKFSIFQNHHLFDLGFGPIEYGTRRIVEANGYECYGLKINIDAKSIKIFDELELSYCHQDKFNMLMPKLDLSMTAEIKISVKFQIKAEFLDIILQPSLESLHMWIEFQISANPAVLAFQRCPNLKKIGIAYGIGRYDSPSKELIAEEDFSKMVCTSKKEKLIYCYLFPILKINPNDLITFLDNFVDINFNRKYYDGRFTLHFKESSSANFLDLKSFITNITQERKQSQIPMAKIHLWCGRNIFYTNI